MSKKFYNEADTVPLPDLEEKSWKMPWGKIFIIALSGSIIFALIAPYFIK